jgi:hypothetical protein
MYLSILRTYLVRRVLEWNVKNRMKKLFIINSVPLIVLQYSYTPNKP